MVGILKKLMLVEVIAICLITTLFLVFIWFGLFFVWVCSKMYNYMVKELNLRILWLLENFFVLGGILEG